MDKINIRKIDRVVLAGAFGTHIDPKYAMVLGMIPDCLLTATGRRAMRREPGHACACWNLPLGAKLRPLCAASKKSKPRSSRHFRIIFVKAMAIPHKSDPYAALAAAVDLPPRDLLAEDAPAPRWRPAAWAAAASDCRPASVMIQSHAAPIAYVDLCALRQLDTPSQT